MKAILKAEFRKLLSVRSTYVVGLLALLLSAGLMAFYIEGMWGKSGSAAGMLSERAVTEIVLNSFSTVSIFVAIVAMLQIVHEYRHNTIVYTLTAANSRTKAFFAKLAVLGVYAVVFSFAAAFLSLILYFVGIAIRGGSLPPQSVDWLDIIGRGLFINLSYMAIGAITAYLSRNIALAIAVVLIVPSTVEQLLSLLLRENSKFLPFTALGQLTIANPSDLQQINALTMPAALLLVSFYLTVGVVTTWYFFLRRDAN